MHLSFQLPLSKYLPIIKLICQIWREKKVLQLSPVSPIGQMPTLGQCTVLPFSDYFVREKIYSCKFLYGGLIVTTELRLASHIY